MDDTDAGLGSWAGADALTARWLWRNGRVMPWKAATIHVGAVGHSSVAAVFEGIKAYRAADGAGLLVFRLDDHVRRLYESARICRLRIPFDVPQLRRAVLDVLGANGYQEDVYIRPWAFPAGIIREQMVPAGAECEVVVDSWPSAAAAGANRGGRAAVSSWIRIGDASTPPRVKAFANYHNGRLALIEARENGHDWAIMLNERAKVTEGPGACVALVRDGTVVTPAVSSGVLEGITRATTLTLLHELGVPVVEREVDRSELYLAQELFFMGTAWEIVPIIAIDGLPVGEGGPGPITTRLAAAYAALVRGATAAHPEWRTEIHW